MPTQTYRTKAGKRVPGVTTVISQNLGWNNRALMIWANREGMEGRDINQRAEEAASIGTCAHAMIEADLKGVDFDQSLYPKEILDKAETAFLAWLEWKDFFELKSIHSEVPLVSETYEYGGCLDIATIKKVRSLIDLKTASGTYEDHLIQLAAYGKLWEENNPDDPIRAYYLLRLGKEDGSFHYHYYPDLTVCWEVFQNLLAIHKTHNAIKKML